MFGLRMHGNKTSDHIKEPIQPRWPFVFAGLLAVFLGLFSFYTPEVAMWWRNSASGVAFAVSSTLLSSLFTTVTHFPGVQSVYVDQAVLEACPGYVADNAVTTRGGSELHVDLTLPRNATGCGVFGQDIQKLTLVVTYETATRLHVKITDANSKRYEVPEEVFPRPRASFVSPSQSDLKFSYTSSPEPFSFTISRSRTNEVLFSTKGHTLIFENQYIRLKTAIPQGANIYGLGEHSHPLRLDTDNGGRGIVRTLWSRDSFGIPRDSNLYGNHPIYVDHRLTGTHGVFLLNSNGMDIKLNQTSPADRSIEYNVIGGLLDYYFFAGSETDPAAVSRQYADLAGHSAEFPYWSLGFHQCRFGYKNYVDVANVISSYEAAGIPLETMWTDIDYMQDRLIFTVDPQYFPLNRVREIVSHLHSKGQKYIVMTDPAVAYHPNTGYAALDRGIQRDVYLKNPNGSYHLGVVWPGVTVFPDWFAPGTAPWWNNEFRMFYSPESGIDIDGVWIDMNEPASFCEFPCTDPYLTAVQGNYPPKRDTLPPAPDTPIFTSTGVIKPRDDKLYSEEYEYLNKRQLPVDPADINDPLLVPPYAIGNSAGALSSRTAYTNVIQANNLTQYDTHNMYGSMMSTATRNAMLARRPNRRPLIITRSTFAGAGKHVGKWLGDNLSTWEQYRMSIAGMLNFASIFNIPMVGSDVCGFGDNTTETLCARWATLGGFYPFYRNHNIDTGISQEFYIWELTTRAAKNAINIRYRLLDYIYTAFHNAHVSGTPVLLPLFYAYPKDTNTFGIDMQFLYGPSVLVSPVTEEGSTSVRYYLPADTWYEFPSLAATRSTGQYFTKNNVGYDQITLHIKGASILALRNESAMTTTVLRTKPFDLLVAPNAQGRASGELYIDDGETIDPPQARTTDVRFGYFNKKLTVQGRFGYNSGVGVGWNKVTIAGVDQAPRNVRLDLRPVPANQVKYDAVAKVVDVQVAIGTLRGFELSFD
ncbi:hypothetical protein NMY22_g12836 [Coprinellus aureogranulatus]|nr:hypothetical protein NMY22_g12836 [Coprinellus aureogranulatus]